MEKPESSSTPGFGGMLAILLLTGAWLAALQLVRCAQAPFGSLSTCATKYPTQDAALLGGIAVFIGGGILVAELRSVLRKRHPTPEPVKKPSLLTFTETWARSTEWNERFREVRGSWFGPEKVALFQELAAYHGQRKALGLRNPDDDEKKPEVTNQGGTRAVLALLCFAWAAWILSGPISCVGDRSRRCVSPEISDFWFVGIGIIAAGFWVMWRHPAVWSGWRPRQQRDLPGPLDWIADKWTRLVAAGRQPTGEEANRRGALIASVAADYMRLARAAGVSKDPLEVAADFGNQIADVADAGEYWLRTEKELRYPRGLISAALYVMIATTDNPKRRDSTRMVLTMLEDYLPAERYAEVEEAVKGAEREYALLDEARRNWKSGTSPIMDDATSRAFVDNRFHRDALSAVTSERGRIKARALERLEERLGPDLAGHESFFIWLNTVVSDAIDVADRLGRTFQQGADAGHVEGAGTTEFYDQLERDLEELGNLHDEITEKPAASRDRPTLAKLQFLLTSLMHEAGLVVSAAASSDLHLFALSHQAFSKSLGAVKRFRDERYATTR